MHALEAYKKAEAQAKKAYDEAMAQAWKAYEMYIWRELTLKEEQEFRQWARENYKLGESVDELWHPVVRDEISKMAHEKLGLEAEG